MKKFLCFLFLAYVLTSCEEMSKNREGMIRITFADALPSLTRSELELPDTNDFILKITDADGKVIFDGTYGDSPEGLTVPKGNYTVSVRSGVFSKPAFSSPLFGDEQCVTVPSGESVSVALECSQLNSGISLKISPAFLDVYPGGSLHLKSEKGSLLYSYSEKRTAYFDPGKVSLVLSNSGKDEVLMTRWLEPREVLAINIGVAGASSGQAGNGLTMTVDTLRNWTQETYVLGGNNGKGESAEAALNVSQAKAAVGDKDVWVQGYIVGGDLTNSSSSFEEPFTSRTNLLLGSRSTVADRELCLAVQLQTGDVRECLNLVDNPGLLGKRVCLKGDIVESYFGLVGIKNVTEFQLL